MEMGVITRDQAILEKRLSVVPCRLSVQAISLSMCPNNTPVPNERTNLRT